MNSVGRCSMCGNALYPADIIRLADGFNVDGMCYYKMQLCEHRNLKYTCTDFRCVVNRTIEMAEMLDRFSCS